MNRSVLEKTGLHAPFKGPPFSLIPDCRGLFLFYGDRSLFTIAPLLAGWRLSRGERVLFLDGNNCFDPYPLVRLANEIGEDPEDFLASLFVSRAFTCHQMGSLIFNQLRSGIERHHPRLIILASPLETFYDESVSDIEARNLLTHLVAALEPFTRKYLFVILSPFPKKSAGRRAFFLSHFKAQARKIFRVARADGPQASAIRITEEKPVSRQWVFPTGRN